MSEDDFKRRPRYKMGSEERSRCIGCGQPAEVLISSNYIRGWGVCAGCVIKAEKIFAANSDVVRGHIANNVASASLLVEFSRRDQNHI